MEAGQEHATSRRKPPPGQWVKGQSGNPNGRKPKTDEWRELERMTKQQVQQRLEEMVGPALKRMLKIVDKGADAEAVRIALALLDRVAGAVPTASFIAAQVHSTSVPGSNMEVISQEQVDAAMLLRLQRRGVLPAPDSGG